MLSERIIFCGAKMQTIQPEMNKLASEGKQDEMRARFNAMKDEVSVRSPQNYLRLNFRKNNAKSTLP